jgi:SAM-dependent methyltransferase
MAMVCVLCKEKIMKENKKFWDRCFKYSNYDYKSLTKGDWDRLISRLRKHNIKTILDLGCGYGHWSIILGRAGFDVYAVDISKSAINILKKWSNEEKLGIKCRVISGTQIDKLKKKFDAVICNSVLDHMCFKDTEETIQKIYKTLKPSGIAYLSFDGREEDNPDNFIILQDGTQKYIKGKNKGMLWRYYTDKEIKKLLSRFKILYFGIRKNGKRDVWIQK